MLSGQTETFLPLILSLLHLPGGLVVLEGKPETGPAEQTTKQKDK